MWGINKGRTALLSLIIVLLSATWRNGRDCSSLWFTGVLREGQCRKREVWGASLIGSPATFRAVTRNLAVPVPNGFLHFSISALWESFFGFDQTFGIWGLEVMRQVPRNKRYLGSNFCSGLVTTWKVSTDRKIFKSFQESFQNFPSSSSEGLEEMSK